MILVKAVVKGWLADSDYLSGNLIHKTHIAQQRQKSLGQAKIVTLFSMVDSDMGLGVL